MNNEQRKAMFARRREHASTFQMESERARHRGNVGEYGIFEVYRPTKGAPKDINESTNVNAYYQLEDVGLGRDYDWGQKNPNRALPKTHTMPKDLRILDKYGEIKREKK